ncbi:MarR family transcriptional regulator [Pseudonocardia sp.]|uniref:MarR family winged helix-turn-helix transcriptional regulator n=1 Tax=Pseudonocardia sp. TaxID=60912 RepID=UPI0025ECD278|nr:MarR family transcriptional regulator [Pseudonocardia sp.]
MTDGAAQRVWAAMRALVTEDDRRAEVCAALGMSFFRIKVLRRIAAEPTTGGLLAERLGSDPPYVSVVVEDLVQRGLVVRTPDATDRRRKVLSVTAAGERTAREAEALLATPPRALTDLPAEHLADLDRALAGVLEPSPES